MSNPSPFIEQARDLVLENLSNEQFGVSELAGAMHMSRSNLLRKVKKETGLSASQFIRKIRLQEAMELLRENTHTVSEVSYKVGFGSSSYFIKCFREQYGYPPGEAAKMEFREPEVQPKLPVKWVAAATLVLLLFALVLYKFSPPEEEVILEKSIAVLPFKNESSDATNVYFINGLMESTLNKLQKIEDVRVVSRTSVEKYRNEVRSVAEIARELNVNYLVEGSGQRVGDQVLLNIQLIEAANDRPVWSEQYSREVTDIFALQNEVARKIAEAVEAIVTPAERERMEKKPTENLLAYDYFLQGQDQFYRRTAEGLEKAIPLFEKAVAEDPQFSLAYANLAIAYYFKDENRKEKQYTEVINNYADKALLYDSQSAESLIAKALYYTLTGEYRLALPHLEKALEYNPNSSAAIQTLADYYARVIPNTGKYLEYALKGIQIDIAANDSLSGSYIYLHLSNAFVQSGFVDEALSAIDKSLDYDPGNYYAPMVRAFVLYAKNKDLKQTRDLLIAELEKDTTRLDILQEVAKLYYFEEDYEQAFTYYKKFVAARRQFGLDIYKHEDIKIGMVYEQMGLDEEAAGFFESYAAYCEDDASIYRSASMAVKHVHRGQLDEAIAQLKVFAQQDNIQYWILLFMEKDPIMKPLLNHPEFEGIMDKIKTRFWENQEKLKKDLEDKGLL
ncbi:helix-turn-helix domain-containing protein [Lentiprolixibacter aurantiacus]|uniref:Helix-turn-helix domain-containing protein n=1 Tax=Lentiprolixibacter aurantiacus TaxID=2993939 RepID=A0AAE3MIT9_9FLAO|nr:helix-turn-helix domain-containing protein [Lentiprolixibacter aurantiacus]MCX2718475.1 helix-turn-helix domain-containing protein [Lentiprolixibacter aurantiacus]